MNRKKEKGFTLVEAIVAAAILSFVIFATLRIITSSVNSITHQGKQIKALHIGQACLGRLEGEVFSKLLPETWIIDSGSTYQLSIYDPNLSSSEVFVPFDDDYWYSSQGLGFSSDDNDDGILVVDSNGTVYTKESSPSPNQYNWNLSGLTLTFNFSDTGKEIAIYYRYYHFINEGGNIPSSDGEGRKKHILQLITEPADESDIIVEEIANPGTYIASSDFTYDSSTRNLEFTNSLDEGKGVWIYYLPENSTDISGPDGVSDNYLDPADNSIVGVVRGSFWDLSSGTPTAAINAIKSITVAEFWKQSQEIKTVELKTFIQR